MEFIRLGRRSESDKDLEILLGAYVGKDTVGELASVDLREEKRIGWTNIESKTISTKEMQLMSLPRTLKIFMESKIEARNGLPLVDEGKKEKGRESPFLLSETLRG
jgi:hypothetical protein